jgi:hypothetical protein
MSTTWVVGSAASYDAAVAGITSAPGCRVLDIKLADDPRGSGCAEPRAAACAGHETRRDEQLRDAAALSEHRRGRQCFLDKSVPTYQRDSQEMRNGGPKH